MKTVAEYLNKNKSIIPCNGKIPVIPEWQKKEFKLEDFKPDHNIGLKLKEDTDIDIDSQRALPFIYKYVQPCSAVFGRGKKPISHYLFKGISKYKKFFLHKDLEKYYKDLPHGSCLLECRSGGDKQTIMPGSIIDGEEVKWQIFEGLSPYPGNILEDLSKVALATGLSILFPSVGNRDDYCYAIACILAKHTEWKDYEIDEFVEHMAEHSGASKPKRGKGTHAYKQIANGGKLKGFNTLREILGLEDAQSLYKMFEWVGVNPPNKNLEELKKKYVYIEDSASMYNIETDIEKKKEDFNNTNLYHFPGGKNKKKAFESLMTDFEFFHENKVIGRAVLPGYDYPIAEIDHKHFYLEPGRYLNLYKGPPTDPVKGDVSDWINPFKRILGDDYYEHLEQYFAAFIQKIFKYKLDLTPEESKEIGPMKIQWGYLYVGPEGTGKKALAETLQRIVHKNLSYVGGYKYDEEELVFAKEISKSMNTRLDLKYVEGVAPYEDYSAAGGSTDVGDVSYTVPTVGFRAATWVPETPAHSWQAVAAGGTTIGDKGMIIASKTLAITAIELIENPKIKIALLILFKLYFSIPLRITLFVSVYIINSPLLFAKMMNKADKKTIITIQIDNSSALEKDPIISLKTKPSETIIKSKNGNFFRYAE